MTYSNENELLSLQALGEAYSYEYNTRGLITKMIHPQGNFAYSYDALGRTTQITRPNSQTTSINYDAIGNPLIINHNNQAQYQYNYDKVNQIVSWQGDGEPKTFQYSALGQLISAKQDATVENFQYDVMGNRTNNNARFNKANQLLEDDQHSYEYDIHGNRTKKTDKTTGKVEVYTYNLRNQLNRYQRFASAEDSVAEQDTQYAYGPLGRRWQKVDSEAGQINYIWSGNQLIGEKTNGTISKIYLGDTVKSEGNYYYYHHDHLSTPQIITDSTGNQVWNAQHLAFGQTSSITSTIENNRRFPGQYYDQESGLHYNYYRDYDPSLGRYLQSDPIGLAGGINTYLYAMTSPLIYTDPNGLLVIGINAGVEITIGKGKGVSLGGFANFCSRA